MAPECRHIGGEPAGTDDHVVVCPDQVFAPGGIDGAVTGAGQAAFGLHFASQGKPVGEGGDHLIGVIGAAIVDHQHFPIQIVRHRMAASDSRVRRNDSA